MQRKSCAALAMGLPLLTSDQDWCDGEASGEYAHGAMPKAWSIVGLLLAIRAASSGVMGVSAAKVSP